MTMTKDQAMQAFEQHRAEWLASARAEAIRIYKNKQAPISIDEVRMACPPPEGADPRVMGGVFNLKQWRKTGYRNSWRRACHNRPVALFELR